MEAQKKYIRTKKEALEAKRDRLENPRPPRLDPPPAPTNRWLLVGVALFMLLPFFSLIFFLPSAMIAQAPSEELTVWVYGTEEEFERIKNWLEPEILANDLVWVIVHATSRDEILYAVRNSWADLMILEEDFAAELYNGLALAPLWDRREGATWENAFLPFWEPAPFQKSFGWAIPSTARVAEGRHLFTVMRQFAAALSRELPPAQLP